MHGYQSNSIDMMQIGYLYNHDLRWNILLPDLLAHGLSDGNTDTYVPTYMVYPLYDAKPSEIQLWLAPGSAHADSYKDHHLEYTATVKKFLQSHQLLDSHK